MEYRNWSKIRYGDKQAFKLLFEEYYSSLCLYANSIINDLELSQDIVSECFVRIWERKEQIQIESSIKSYLQLSVRNAIYSYLRSPQSRRVNMNAIIEKLEDIPFEEYNIESEDKILRVYKLIEKLPDQRRQILELASIKGKTYKEIADILGISVNTVNTQMSRAYRFLRDNLNMNDFFFYFLFKKVKIN